MALPIVSCCVLHPLHISYINVSALPKDAFANRLEVSTLLLAMPGWPGCLASLVLQTGEGPFLFQRYCGQSKVHKAMVGLFVHIERVTEEMKVYLNSSCSTSYCVQLLKYDSVREHLIKYLEQADVRVWVGTEYTNQALYELITPEEKLLQSTYSPVLTTKAVKDNTEQKILRAAHIRDAVAVMQLLHHLERAVPEGKETEITAAEFVNVCRSPSNETARKLRVDEMYLVDSGGQYLGSLFCDAVCKWPVGFQSSNIPFQEGMFTSIEPGYYKENDFGIRIEDIALTVPAKTQLSWLDSHYKVIRDKVGPELKSQGLTEVYDWMIQNTEPLVKDGASAVVSSFSLLLLLLPMSLL
ncbi:hypothetical protein NFI96_000760 [Prochilodus magdalenae]|nr:hypothetical protein NFI96_000760 [Prochilodus magdalenae]